MSLRLILGSVIAAMLVASSAAAQVPHCVQLPARDGVQWAYYYVRGRNGNLPANGSPPATFQYGLAPDAVVTPAEIAGPCFAVPIPDAPPVTTFHAVAAYWTYYYENDSQLNVPTGEETGTRPENPRLIQLRFRPSKLGFLAQSGDRAGQLLDRSQIAPAAVTSYDLALGEMMDMADRLGRGDEVLASVQDRLGEGDAFDGFLHQRTLAHERAAQLELERLRLQESRLMFDGSGDTRQFERGPTIVPPSGTGVIGSTPGGVPDRGGIPDTSAHLEAPSSVVLRGPGARTMTASSGRPP